MFQRYPQALSQKGILGFWSKVSCALKTEALEEVRSQYHALIISEYRKESLYPLAWRLLGSWNHSEYSIAADLGSTACWPFGFVWGLHKKIPHLKLITTSLDCNSIWLPFPEVACFLSIFIHWNKCFQSVNISKFWLLISYIFTKPVCELLMNSGVYNQITGHQIETIWEQGSWRILSPN